MPALHFRSYWGRSLLVITIFSSSWCLCLEHIACPGPRASLEDGCRHPAVRREPLQTVGTPPVFTQENTVKGCSCPLSLVKLIQTFTVTLQLKLRPALSPWTCLLITGLCLTPGAGVMGLICWLQFSSEPQTCLITRGLSSDQGSWLNLATAIRWLAVKQKNSPRNSI